ncbi:MAG: NUDIX domain-containing protein, partial [Burkholderiaceae bacterium]
REAILDANVRRVLTRVLGFDADLAVQSNLKQLWEEATALLPHRDLQRSMPRYTQGMMDLGATVCLPRQPLCGQCPVRSQCAALKLGDPLRFPVRSRTLRRTAQSVWLLWMRSDANAVWLQRRPSTGVWADLYCMPWFDSREDLEAQLPATSRMVLREQPVLKHVLTHKDLYLHPVQIDSPDQSVVLDDGQWVDGSAWPQLGLPAPVRRLLTQA